MIIVLWPCYDINKFAVFAFIEGCTRVGLKERLFLYIFPKCKCILMYRTFHISIEQLGVIPSERLRKVILPKTF